MNALTREWVEKADGDYATAGREALITDAPNYDGVCFHAQQCVEKYLKAVLQEASLPVPRTHDLPTLLAVALPIVPGWKGFESDLVYLTTFAVEFRYPGYAASTADAQRAVAVAAAFRQSARQRLGLT